MIKHNMQYQLSPGDLATDRSPYLYLQITCDIDLRICTITRRLILDTFTTNRVNINDTIMLFDSDTQNV